MNVKTLNMMIWCTIVCLFVACSMVTSARGGDLIFQVNVDTSSIQGASGFLDFQLNPQQSPLPTPPAQAVTVEANGFASNGLLGSILPPTIGEVSGQLPNQLTLMNSAPINDFTQAFAYGSYINFDVLISGDAVTNPNNGSLGSGFLFSLLDSNLNPLLTTDPGGTLAEITIYPDGTTDVSVFPPANGATPLVVVTPLATVPEPTSMIPFGTGLVTLAGYTWYRGKRLQ